MPKASLSFILPEEQDDFNYAKNGVKYYLVLEELDNWLRAKMKYEDKESISIDEVRKQLRELLEEQNVTLF